MSSRLHGLGISAVLPAYNEVEIITDVVRRVEAAFAAAGIAAHETVVVDDGSVDGTGAAVEALRGHLPRVRLVRHGRNRGYGAALRTGFETATLELVWLLDSDGQFDPADLHLLLEAWCDGAYVIGYRAQRRDSLLRRINHAAFFGVVRALAGPTVRDVNCAFRLFPRELGVGLTSDGAVVSTEMALRARRAGMPIIEIPVPHHPRTTGSPTGARPAVVLRAFAELLSLRRRMTRAPWPGLGRTRVRPASAALGEWHDERPSREPAGPAPSTLLRTGGAGDDEAGPAAQRGESLDRRGAAARRAGHGEVHGGPRPGTPPPRAGGGARL